MKKAKLLIMFIFVIFLFYSLLNIKETNSSTMNILITFSKTILPALLPFLILNQLIIKLGIIDLFAYFLQFISYPLFKISGKGASIIIIGILNGFPSSAIFTSLLVKENQIGKDEAQRLINSIFFPSISFIFVIIGSYLNNRLLTLLAISIYLSGFIILYISSFKIKYENNYITFKQTKINIKDKLKNFILIKEIKNAISYAFNTLMNILGILILFSIPCNIVANLIKTDYSYFFQGLLEFSMPTIALLNSSISLKNVTLLVCILLSFSGLSSILQATLFINEADLNTKKFITNRIMNCLLSFIILYLFLFFL